MSRIIKKTRSNYWSNGWVAKLTAKWLGAPPRLKCGTMEEWNDFDKNQKQHFRTQEVIEDVLKTIQNICMFPFDVYYSAEVYIRNRFIDKLHILQTKLEPGEYYEYETRLLHGMFDSFVLFIEEAQTIENLNWELTLRNKYEWLPEEEAKLQPDYGAPCQQAIKAQEKLALYTWWKVTRPARVDGYEASGFAKWSEENKKADDNVFSLFVDDGDTVKAETRQALSKKWHDIDDEHIQEDEDMMIRLIKIRCTLWT